MGTYAEFLESIDDAGGTPEFVSQLKKVEDLLPALTSLDFEAVSATTLDFNFMHQHLTNVGCPAEALAEHAKIKSLLISE